MSKSIVIVSYRVQPGQVNNAIERIRSLVATVLANEPDCGGIEVLQDSTDPTRITLIENWSSKEIFVGPHMQQPHIQIFIGSAGEFLAGPPDISFWHPVGGA